MKILIICVLLLITTVSFAKDISFRLPTREELIQQYKVESLQLMIESLKTADIASILETGCYDVVISSDSMGEIELLLKEKK